MQFIYLFIPVFLPVFSCYITVQTSVKSGNIRDRRVSAFSSDTFQNASEIDNLYNNNIMDILIVIMVYLIIDIILEHGKNSKCRRIF